MSSLTTPRCGWIEFKFGASVYHYSNFEFPLGFGHAHCMSNLITSCVKITKSHEIWIFQSSNNWICAVQIIVGEAVKALLVYRKHCKVSNRRLKGHIYK